MQPKSDAQLLREYAEHSAETAFAEIVARHTNLVYSAALRQVDSPDIAAEVAQGVFIGLASSARPLSRTVAENASLASWLCRSARNISLNLRRDEFRRHSRERQAMQNLDAMPDTTPDWERLRSVLDEAMAGLSEPDYDAVVLRFFKNQDLRTVGLALGVSDDTAQKRVSRALDKLRDLLSQRGVATPAVALAAVISANAVQVAPAGLAITISTAAALAGTTLATAATATASKAIAMTTLQKTLVAATLAAAVGSGVLFWHSHQASNGPIPETSNQSESGNIHETVALDLIEFRRPSIRNAPNPGPTYLRIGQFASMEWSVADIGKREGYLYFWNPLPETKSPNIWAFAACKKTHLGDVTMQDLETVFCGANDDEKGRAAFGTNWVHSSSHQYVRVREGQIVLARLLTKPSLTYVLELAEQDPRGKLRVRYVEMRSPD